MNWYRNAHFHELNNAKKLYNDLVAIQISGVKIPSKFIVKYTIYMQNRRGDGGNVRAVIEKFVLDALIKCGVIVDDRYSFLQHDEAYYFLDRSNPRAEIQIIEV